MTWLEMVAEFHERFGHPVNHALDVEDDFINHLRVELIGEEARELMEAAADRDAVGMADALGDLIYVVCGAALTWGIDLDAVVREVHRSNLSKLDEDGRPIYRADGKVLKGPNYSPPDLLPLLKVGRRAA